MKKISLLFGLAAGISFPAAAQDVSFNADISADMSISTGSEIALYNFSEGLLNAARDCSSYSENFSANNPNLSVFGLKPEIVVDIEGKDENGLCRFSVSNKVTGISASKLKCRISEEQQREILNAMLDRSTTPVTETFTTYGESSDGEGNVQRFPIATTMTGSRFDIAWNKIRGGYCEEEVSEPTEEEAEKLGNDMDNLSETFIQNLKNCTPYTETKQIFFFNEEVSIVGKEDDKCRLRYGQFELFLPEDRLSSVASFSDIRNLTRDGTLSRYVPVYSNRRLMFNLYDCMVSQKGNNGGTTTETIGEIKITSAFSSAFADQHCVLNFINTLDNNGQNTIYSKTCHIPADALFGLLAPYSDVIEQNKEQTITGKDGSISYRGESMNNETIAADAALAEKLQTSSWCSEKEQLLPQG